MKRSGNLKSDTLVKFLVHWEKIRISLSNGFARSPSTVFSRSFIEILGSTGAFSSANFGNFICSLFSQSSTSSTLRFPELWMPLCFKYSFNQGTGLQWKLLAEESAILCPLSLAYMGLPSSQERASKNFERSLLEFKFRLLNRYLLGPHCTASVCFMKRYSHLIQSTERMKIQLFFKATNFKYLMTLLSLPRTFYDVNQLKHWIFLQQITQILRPYK